MYGSNLKRAQSADAIKSRTSDVSPAVCKWTLKTSDGTMWPKWSGRHAPYLWRRTGWLGAVMAPSLSGQSCNMKTAVLAGNRAKVDLFQVLYFKRPVHRDMTEWTLLKRLLDAVHQHSTMIGRLWLTVMVIFRLLIVAVATEDVYTDEQEMFVCNTLQPGCPNVCYNAFAPISQPRFWVFQIITVSSPSLCFIIYTWHNLSKQPEGEQSREAYDRSCDSDSCSIKSHKTSRTQSCWRPRGHHQPKHPGIAGNHQGSIQKLLRRPFQVLRLPCVLSHGFGGRFCGGSMAPLRFPCSCSLCVHSDALHAEGRLLRLASHRENHLPDLHVLCWGPLHLPQLPRAQSFGLEDDQEVSAHQGRLLEGIRRYKPRLAVDSLANFQRRDQHYFFTYPRSSRGPSTWLDLRWELLGEERQGHLQRNTITQG